MATTKVVEYFVAETMVSSDLLLSASLDKEECVCSKISLQCHGDFV